MHENLEGGCLCGRVRYRATAPEEVCYCHCRMCRKHMGQPVTAWMRIAPGAVEWTGEAPALYRSSAEAERGFCGTCGSPLLCRHRHRGVEGYAWITVASLDDPSETRPARHYWTDRGVSWLDIADDLPRRPGPPDDEDRSHLQGGAGGCLCGHIRYAAAGAPRSVTYCHCAMCRRGTGAPVTAWASYRADEIRWEGERALYRSSSEAERGFCPRCGTPLTFRYVANAEYLGLAVGSFDRPEGLAPQRHYWTESRIPWLEIADELPRLAQE